MNIFDMMFGEQPAAGQAINLLTKTVTDFQEAGEAVGGFHQQTIFHVAIIGLRKRD